MPDLIMAKRWTAEDGWSHAYDSAVDKNDWPAEVVAKGQEVEVTDHMRQHVFKIGPADENGRHEMTYRRVG